MSYFVILVDDQHPDEATARPELEAALARGACPPSVEEYRGIWRMPTPERPAVHLFTRPYVDISELQEKGWHMAFSKEDLDGLKPPGTGQNPR